jgi:hypothetical protein
MVAELILFNFCLEFFHCNVNIIMAFFKRKSSVNAAAAMLNEQSKSKSSNPYQGYYSNHHVHAIFAGILALDQDVDEADLSDLAVPEASLEKPLSKRLVFIIINSIVISSTSILIIITHAT